MKKKELNPIAKKIKGLTDSHSITTEQLCVKMGMKHATFRNMYHPRRCDKLSKYTEALIRLGLKGVITEQDWKDYYEFRSQVTVAKKSKLKPLMEDTDETEPTSFEDQCGDEAQVD